jgi:GNAT superfamily N-acetyltransferase
MSDFLAIEENLRCAMQFFGEATGYGEVRGLDGAVALFSGLDYGVFNIALLTRRITGDDGGLEARLLDIGRFFKDRTLHWSVWLCEDLLDSATRRRERQVFLNFGMRGISHPPGMSAPALKPPARRLPEIECRPVADAATRLAFAEITSVAFEIPIPVAHAVYTPQRAWNGAYKGFVGFANGRPVSIVAMVAAAGVTGIYSLGTLPEFRQKGYGEALLRAAAAESRRRTGLEPLVLQSTEAGYSLYKRLGFRDITRFSVYLTK